MLSSAHARIRCLLYTAMFSAIKNRIYNESERRGMSLVDFCILFVLDSVITQFTSTFYVIYFPLSFEKT